MQPVRSFERTSSRDDSRRTHEHHDRGVSDHLRLSLRCLLGRRNHTAPPAANTAVAPAAAAIVTAAAAAAAAAAIVAAAAAAIIVAAAAGGIGAAAATAAAAILAAASRAPLACCLASRGGPLDALRTVVGGFTVVRPHEHVQRQERIVLWGRVHGQAAGYVKGRRYRGLLAGKR